MDPSEKTNEANPTHNGQHSGQHSGQYSGQHSGQHSGHRRSRRSRATRRRRTITLAIGVAAIFAVLGVAIATALHRQSTDVAGPSERAAGGQTRTATSSPGATPKLQARRVYPHSIVPGGVHSAEEVARAKAHDPVVAAHYAAVDPSRMRVQRLAQPLAAHVSYRIGNKVYWTKGKVQLAAGEQVLTDGKTTLRARCGNIVSTVRRTPTFAGEPEEAEFELVVEPDVLAPIVVASVPQLLIQHKGSAWTRALKPPPPTATIPGPNTLVLLGFGVAAALTRYHSRRRRPRRTNA